MIVNGEEIPVIHKIDYTKQVRYEYMKAREAIAAIRSCPVGYLPIGCLERHGDHLPMGLDVIKAYGVCCLVAQGEESVHQVISHLKAEVEKVLGASLKKVC